MNELIPQNFGALSTRFQGVPTQDELSAGVQGGFGHIGYKGKVWSTRYRGEETQLMREDGDGPRSSIEVIILKAPSVVSKIFYEKGYVEGSNQAPDCFSTNGQTPDPGAAKRQHTSCAACPKNAWGSRITEGGKQGKACQDSKRLAVVPLGDIRNEALGGPMLLRIPAASLGDLASFGQKMASLGYPSYSIGVRIAFDPKEAYPKFVFSAIRPLTDAEADLVMQMRDGPEVARILAENTSSPTLPPSSTPSSTPSVFEQPPKNAPPNNAPMTGTAFTPPAQPVVSKAPIPDMVSRPTMPAQSSPVVSNPASTSGFGGGASTAASSRTATLPIVDAVPAPNTNKAFEDELDAMVDNLMGPAPTTH